MDSSPSERLRRLQELLPKLTPGQLLIVERITKIFGLPHQFSRNPSSDLLSDTSLNDFGDALMIHHCFSAQAFTKDKFEYALEAILKANGRDAKLSRRGNPGWDIILDGVKFSLKTQADNALKLNEIHISKFMELGGGSWTDKEEDLVGLRQQFLHHLEQYDRVLTLRTLKRPPPFYLYELVEIPKALLLKAETGRLEMRHGSSQTPKPGYCYVEQDGEACFQLYFDGGGERKLQVKHLRKSLCEVHATWQFEVEATETVPGATPAES